MSVGSLGASSGAYSYLQSILQQQQSTAGAGTTSDPVTSLLNAFYPSGGTSDPLTAAPADGSGAPSPALPNPLPFSPDTMSAMISAQEQSGPQDCAASQAQQLFGEFDTDGNGQISKSEFENAFGSNADMSRVDGLFNALDANGDGSVSQSELTSAAQQSQAAHHGHHHHAHGSGGGQGGGQGGGLADLLSGTDATGASSQTDSNSDGSTTTTISYADGSKVSLTTPAGSPADNSSNGGATSQDTSNNLIEQLIKLQSQMLAQSAGSLSSSMASSLTTSI